MASCSDDSTSSQPAATEAEASLPNEPVEATTVPASTAPPTTVAPTTTIDVGINPNGVDPLPPLPADVALPIVFVHGFAGSAQQYESQKMRFVANGYPADHIVAYDHDGAGFDIAAYALGAAQVIDDVLAEFGVAQVYLVGHSRGTAVSNALLEDPAQAAKIAKYVAIDGAACPVTGAVPCVAPNQAQFPGQSHVEVATSKESFAAQYEFLVGEPPAVVDIEPQREPVVISGRAVNFPANTGREGVTLEVWTVDSATGQRVDNAPLGTFEIAADGAFGPLEIVAGEPHEFVLTSSATPIQHHLYLQPYVRDSDFVRLLSSPPDGPTRMNTNRADAHSVIIAMRMREWHATDDTDLDGDQRDVLWFSTDGNEPVDALAQFVGNGAIGLHVHDDLATPGVSSIGPLPYFSEQPFQSGVDVFMPSSIDASGTITITNVPRGDSTAEQTINVPNWPSSGHVITVVFADYAVA